MCGIAVILGVERARAAPAIGAMTSSLRHRGPDDEGVLITPSGRDESGPCVALGHRRLSILDLSPLGHQPMVHPITGDAVVFNGEIYNFKEVRARLERRGVHLRGHSDTEVLLHALTEWGTDCLADLAGMFAFAFYQRARNRLLLARDPLGIKPLYVGEHDGALVVASEVRAVIRSGLVPPVPDRRGVATLLAYGSVQEPFTYFEGVRAFPSGYSQWIEVEADGSWRRMPERQFWRFPALDRTVTEDQACARLDQELTRSVREHLVADVPVGVFLSSGLDSTVMALLASRESPRVKTFTIGFSDEPDLSESEMARRSAGALSVEHHDRNVTGADAIAWTRDWMKSLDQPSFDGLNTYIVSRTVREAGIVVAISGLGGDELFGGYAPFVDVPRAYKYATLASWSPGPLRRFVLAAASFSQPLSLRQKLKDMEKAGTDLARLYLMRRRANGDAALHALGFKAEELGLDPSFQDPLIVNTARENWGDPVATVSRLESRFIMKNMLLRDTDATSMQHSLEIRVPFLDRRVVEYAYTIPGAIRLPEGVANKHLLRRIYGPQLRPEIMTRPKRGFTLPIRRWMTQPLRDTCEEGLAQLKRSGLVRPEAVDATWSRFLNDPEDRVWSHAFLLCVLGEYGLNAGEWAKTGAAAGGARTSPARVDC